MRKTILLFATVLAACSSEPRQEDIVLQTAKTYYEQLLHGDYKAFVAGTMGYGEGDSIPAAYREQLETNMKQFVARQKADHQGIDSVSSVRAKLDTTSVNGIQTISASAFLNIHYSDKTTEQVVVPMVLKDNVWIMR